MKTIKRDTLVRKICETKGQIFSVKFVKLNGQERDLVGRLGVSKGVKGTGRPSRTLPKYIGVFDMHIQDFRLVNKSTIKSAVINGTAYNIG